MTETSGSINRTFLLENCTFTLTIVRNNRNFYYFATNFKIYIIVGMKNLRKIYHFLSPKFVALIYRPIEWGKFRDAVRNVVTATASRPVFVEHAMFFQLRRGGF